ncbi:MAG TPA: SDR family oxidoreductase [Fimbriimonas sp.]|nr:SDR family oxidoreductase [Fimbriimonas sp.]
MNPLSIDLRGQVAVVTGGAGELGRPICRTLAACKAKVAVHYHSSEGKAKALVEEITAAGGAAQMFKADVTDLEDTKKLHDAVREAMGVATIIVNGAVIQYDWVSVLDQAIEDYESQFKSCVLHNVNMAKAFVPDMISNGKGGRVIGINTECAMQCFPSQSAYVAGKRGMDGVMRILAKEIGEHQITVNQVAPGWMRSDRIRAMEGDVQAGYAKNVPLKRAGDDQEIANLVAFLASDLAGYITGAYISVSGGNVMPTI